MSKPINATTLATAQAEGNVPITLCEIALDSGTKYFCDAAADIVFPTGGQTYTAWPFAYDGIRTSITGEVDRVRMTFDNADLTFSVYLAEEEWQGRVLTLKKVFSNLLSSSSYAVTMWSGDMAAIDINESVFVVQVLSPMVALERKAPRRLFDVLCPWRFGETECGADTGELTSQTADSGGSTTTMVDAARSEADDYWRYGTLTFTSGDLSGEAQIITTSVSSTGVVTTINPFSDAPTAGDQYKIKRGCAKTAGYCINTYDNWDSFGGFVGLPERQR